MNCRGVLSTRLMASNRDDMMVWFGLDRQKTHCVTLKVGGSSPHTQRKCPLVACQCRNLVRGEGGFPFILMGWLCWCTLAILSSFSL